MKKEWVSPEISCLSIKQTESFWGGSGTDGASYGSTTNPPHLVGSLSGNMTFDQYLDSKNL